MLFRTPDPDDAELRAVARIDELRRSLRHRIQEPRRWTGLVRRVLLARNIQGSNTIEGYNVSLDDAIAAAEGDEILDANHESRLAVQGYRNALTYVLQLVDESRFAYSEDLLRGLHYMMLHHDSSKNPGRYRPGVIYVRHGSTGEIVYEGPDADDVPGLMVELVDSLNHADGHGPVLVRAAMAHLNLVMIHPFRDGTGRMARALQTLVLSRDGSVAPELASIEEYLGRNTSDYYRVLADVGNGGWHPQRDARGWVRFCLLAHFRQARIVLRRVKETEAMWNLLEDELKRHGLSDRMIPALYYAASGLRLRNAMYRAAADISDALASRDLGRLVSTGLLLAHGERRGRYYTAGARIAEIRTMVRQPLAPADEDPFT